MPVIWAIPTGYFTAEMSSMFDENGGYVLWIENAFGAWVGPPSPPPPQPPAPPVMTVACAGEAAGFLNAYNGLVVGVLDLAVYVVLGVAYVSDRANDSGAPLSWGVTFAIKLAIIIAVTGFNLRGLTVVERVREGRYLWHFSLTAASAAACSCCC
jgi:amino acid transporter